MSPLFLFTPHPPNLYPYQPPTSFSATLCPRSIFSTCSFYPLVPPCVFLSIPASLICSWLDPYWNHCIFYNLHYLCDSAPVECAYRLSLFPCYLYRPTASSLYSDYRVRGICTRSRVYTLSLADFSMFCWLICVRARTQTQTTTPYSTLLQPTVRLLPFYSDYRVWGFCMRLGLCMRSGLCTRSGLYTLSLAGLCLSLDLRPGPNPNHNTSYSTRCTPTHSLL